MKTLTITGVERFPGVNSPDAGDVKAKVTVDDEDFITKIEGTTAYAEELRSLMDENQIEVLDDLLPLITDADEITWDDAESSAEDQGEDEATEMASGEVSKVDTEKRLVFGWAYVTHDKDGNVAIDKSGDFVDDYEEIEKAAYDFVIKSRAGDIDHTNMQTSEMVESMVFTPEKIKAMGIPEGVLPSGWWVGFRVNDQAAWDSVKQGQRMSFSVHGKGLRKEVD